MPNHTLQRTGGIALLSSPRLVAAVAESIAPMVDGRRGSVSAADVNDIVRTSQQYIDSEESKIKGRVYRVHVVSANKVQVYFGEHLGAGPLGIATRLEAERTRGAWRITHNYLKS